MIYEYEGEHDAKDQHRLNSTFINQVITGELENNSLDHSGGPDEEAERALIFNVGYKFCEGVVGKIVVSLDSDGEPHVFANAPGFSSKNLDDYIQLCEYLSNAAVLISEALEEFELTV